MSTGSQEPSPTWSLGSRGNAPPPGTWTAGAARGPGGTRPLHPGRASERLQLADRLGNYVIVRELARGGMGAVYEARHVETGGRYALKTALTSDPEALARFRREAQLLAALDHPHLVRVHVADLEGERPWFVQDLLEGGSLETRLRQGALPVDAALDITRKVGAALAHAHARGVIHRDLKPSNVLFDQDGEPKLVDFGIARAVDSTSARLTASGEVLGSPGYMAPEQALGLRVEDVRTDVYALGALLYAMAVGHAPFTGTNAIEVIEAVTRLAPRPLASERPEVPAAVSELVERAMFKDPGARPLDIETFLRELEAATSAPPAPPRGRRLVLGLAFAAAASLVGAAGVLIGLAPPPTATEPPPPPRPTEPAPPAPAPAPPWTATVWPATLVDGAVLDLGWENTDERVKEDFIGFTLRQRGAPKLVRPDRAEVELLVERVWFEINISAGAEAVRHDTARPDEPTRLPRVVEDWFEREVAGARLVLRLDPSTGAVGELRGLPPPPRAPRQVESIPEGQAWRLVGMVCDEAIQYHLDMALHLFPDEPTSDRRWELTAPVYLPWARVEGVRICDRTRERGVERIVSVARERRTPQGPRAAVGVTGEATLEGARLRTSRLEIQYLDMVQSRADEDEENVQRVTVTVR